MEVKTYSCLHKTLNLRGLSDPHVAEALAHSQSGDPEIHTDTHSEQSIEHNQIPGDFEHATRAGDETRESEGEDDEGEDGVCDADCG